MTNDGMTKESPFTRTTTRTTADRRYFPAISLILSALLAGCNFAPKYHRPPVETPRSFKEQTPEQSQTTNAWKTAQPADGVTRGKWWEMFNDAELNDLEAQTDASNQNIAAASASFLSARAIMKETRSQLFPTLIANPSLTYSRQRSFANQTGGSPQSSTITD